MGGWAVLIVVAVIVFIIIVGVLSGIRIGASHAPRAHRAPGQVQPLRRAGGQSTWTIPFGVERMYQVDIRETLVDATPQTIITNDNLNARVDAQVYLKVKPDEESVKASQYNVSNYQYGTCSWHAPRCVTSSAP